MVSRREFLKFSAAMSGAIVISSGCRSFIPAPVKPEVERLGPGSIKKFGSKMVIPPAMPRVSRGSSASSQTVDYYEIAVRQFQQQILPAGMPKTTVWSYGSAKHPDTFNYPAFTIEARYNQPVQVKWINDLRDPANNKFLPHLLPVDQTLHWANPPGGEEGRDAHGMDPLPYSGPVPLITHVHGAHTHDWADGYAEAWFLPDAADIPKGFAREGSFYSQFKSASPLGGQWTPGSALFEYPNGQRATTLWYHDHSLGMTRLNVYAGPAGFYLLRGGPDDGVVDSRTGTSAVLPGPAPEMGDSAGQAYYEIPIVIQDRTFNVDGSLFYPENRAYFEGLNKYLKDNPVPPYLNIPFHPDMACDNRLSEIGPIWNPEFFGDVMVVNGLTWPFLEVEQRRYRFRFLNGCNSRFLILKFDHPAVQVWQIGTDGGFIEAPVDINEVNDRMLLLSPAERADVIVDFTAVPVGTPVTLLNLGPDEPYGGGVPGEDFDPADPETTGQVMEFRVISATGEDNSTPLQYLQLPAIPQVLDAPSRAVSLNEESSKSVMTITDTEGNVVLNCESPDAEPFGPSAAELGILDTGSGMSKVLGWDEPITENPKAGSTETWEIYNFTADAHPIHIHLVQFRVVNRQALATDDEGLSTQPAELVGDPRPPEAWESGYKDTVIVYPGELARIQAKFDIPGRYVWHCHIVEHEDNEMMRPFDVVS
jgi:spore coat protein A